MNIEEMTREEIEQTHLAFQIRLQQTKQIYWIICKNLGKSNEAAEIIWQKYLDLDKESEPFAKKVQEFMHNDMFSEIDDEERRIFNRFNG